MHRALLLLPLFTLLPLSACGTDTPVLARACPPSGIDEFGRPCLDVPPDPCGGVCVPRPPVEEGWSEPVLVWRGPAEEAPLCPEVAPALAWQGYEKLSVEPFQCAKCLCDPPDVACEIPNLWHARTAIHCQGQDEPFHAQNGWDGSCTYLWAIKPEKMCGEVPCVASLAIEAPRVPSKLCTPRTDGPNVMPTPVTDVVLACKEGSARSCVDQPESSCQAKAPEGFQSCIFHEGFAACPEGWPERHEYRGGYDDLRTCTACGCKPSIGAVCRVEVTAYDGFTCIESQSLGSLVLEAGEPGCMPLPTGIGLGSKTAELLEFSPGSCEPYGGTSEGTITPEGSQSFCCRKYQ